MILTEEQKKKQLKNLDSQIKELDLRLGRIIVRGNKRPESFEERSKALLVQKLQRQKREAQERKQKLLKQETKRKVLH